MTSMLFAATINEFFRLAHVSMLICCQRVFDCFRKGRNIQKTSDGKHMYLFSVIHFTVAAIGKMTLLKEYLKAS